MNRTEKKPWPTDAVMIVAANKGKERREQMESVHYASCRECGRLVAYDGRTYREARRISKLYLRPIRFFCVDCCVQHRQEDITHFVDHRKG